MAYADRPIGQFLSEIASRNVVPAGGTAAAVVGATGASLCEMACIHTIGTDEDAGAAPELAEVGDDLGTQRTVLLELADRDAEAVDDLLTASRDRTPEAEAKRATGVPLAIAEACLTVIDHAVVVTEESDPNVRPDAVTGTFLARAALRAAVFTVRSNVGEISDPSFVEEMEERAAEVDESSRTAFDRVMANVEGDA